MEEEVRKPQSTANKPPGPLAHTTGNACRGCMRWKNKMRSLCKAMLVSGGGRAKSNEGCSCAAKQRNLWGGPKRRERGKGNSLVIHP